MVYDLMAAEEDAGKRLDLFLTQKLDTGYSRSYIQKLIANNAVTLNGGFVKAHHKVTPGDKIHIEALDQKPSELIAQDISLKIIYEDEDILIIDKPSGLTVHPGAGNQEGTLVNALLYYTKSLSSINPERPGIVHRLDKETSGVMVVAKNNSSHLSLARQFAKHSIQRKYIALVNGVMELDEGIIDLPLGKDARDFRKQTVSFTQDARQALTRYRVMKRLAQATLVELSPETGRTHQLLVHLSHIGHPILGDAKYGKFCAFERLALHALELGFKHPRTKELVSFRSPIPIEFLRFSKGQK